MHFLLVNSVRKATVGDGFCGDGEDEEDVFIEARETGGGLTSEETVLEAWDQSEEGHTQRDAPSGIISKPTVSSEVTGTLSDEEPGTHSSRSTCLSMPSESASADGARQFRGCEDIASERSREHKIRWCAAHVCLRLRPEGLTERGGRGDSSTDRAADDDRVEKNVAESTTSDDGLAGSSEENYAEGSTELSGEGFMEDTKHEVESGHQGGSDEHSRKVLPTASGFLCSELLALQAAMDVALHIDKCFDLACPQQAGRPLFSHSYPLVMTFQRTGHGAYQAEKILPTRLQGEPSFVRR